jgi:outer membrane receptor for ferrienterochelin and colicins
MGVYLFGQIRNRQAYDHNKDGFSDIPLINSETVGFRSYFKTSTYSKLSLEYHHIHEKRRGGNKLDLQPHETDITEQTNYKIDGLNLSFQYFAPNQKHKIETYTSAQYIDRSSYYGTDMNPDAYGSTTDITALVGAQYVFSAKKFLFAPYDLTVGAEFNYNRMNDKIAAYNRDLLQNIYIGGLFLQNEWKHKDFSVLLGARLDKHNLVKLPVFSPRVNFRYNPLANLNLRLSYSSGYRAPQAYDEDLHVEAVGGQVSLISLDDNLRPEYSHSVSASADFYHSFGIVETNFLAEGFFTYLKDVFALVKTGTDVAGNSLLLRTNQSAAMVAGLSLETKVSIAKKFEIQLGYTFQKSQYIEDFQWSDNPNLEAQRKMFRSPDHYAYLMSNFYFPKNFGLSVFGNITGSMLLQHSAGFVPEDCEVSSPVFYDFGFKFSYDIKLFANAKLNLNIGIKNIFNSFQSDIDKGSLKDAGYMYGPSLPRTYFFGIKIEF